MQGLLLEEGAVHTRGRGCMIVSCTGTGLVVRSARGYSEQWDLGLC